MKLIKTESDRGSLRRLSAILLVSCIFLSTLTITAQSPAKESMTENSRPDGNYPIRAKLREVDSGFRVETVPVAGGAEIVTVFSKQSHYDGAMQGPVAEIPLVSVLRDTLGDSIVENDRLRYVWMHTYTNASLMQKISAFVPFLYTRTTNKGNVGTEAPPPVIDVQVSDKAVWNKVLWMVFKKLVLSERHFGVKASALQYGQNAADYRRSAVAGALAVLSLYQEIGGERVLTDSELKDIQARLILSDKTFGGHMQSENLGRFYDNELAKSRDFRGHNWELLRQYAEAQGLYFDPLVMPDGTARHALVWTDVSDIAANKGKKFESRFLNIKNPWTDDKLTNWKGYTQIRWYDADNRQVESDTPNAKPRTMVPLALYGLDHPKIPVILVDFRDNGNPKMREMTRRLLSDITSNVLSLSRFSSLPYFLGRFIYDFASGRRGADLNQASRLRSYSQLKLLLSLDASLDVEFRNDISHRIESATLNPLQNDTDVEARLARAQYANLMDYAKRPDGLPKKITQDRREEMSRLKHGNAERALLAMTHVLSLGLYTHREKETPELFAKMDIRRQLDHHERYLREVAFESAKPEIDSNVAELKRSLTFISENGAAAKEKTTRALAKIFAITNDEDMSSLCLAGLYRINSSSAKKELLAIYNDSKLPDRWRIVCARYLKLALEEGQRISARDAVVIAAIAAN
jgi:hypothetical protein